MNERGNVSIDANKSTAHTPQMRLADIWKPKENGKGNMPFIYRINQITFSDKTVLNLPNLTVIVGPNNSGKSRALKDIIELTCSNDKDVVVINQVQTALPTSAKSLNDSYGVRVVEKGSYRGHFRFLNPKLNEGGNCSVRIDMKWPQDYDPYVTNPDHFSYFFGSQVTAYLATENRLELVSQSQSAGEESEVSNLLQLLYSCGSPKEKEIRNLVAKAFPGVEVALDFSSPQRLGFRVSDNFNSLPPDPRDAKPFLENCAQLDEQGDGLRSYVGIVVALLTLNRSVFLIDEPEAFLHPPQAFRLGQFIASQASANRQIVVATHSADVLRGIIFKACNAQIVRIDRIGNSNLVKLLDPRELETLARDPLLSAAGVLDGLFYSGVVVTEADADSRFFQSLATRINPSLDIHFVNADNKQTVPKVLTTYKKLGVRCAGIVDIDVLNDGEEFKKQLESASIKGEKFETSLTSQRKINEEINSSPAINRLQNASEQISKMKTLVDEAAAKNSSEHEKALGELKRLLERLKADTSTWQAVKKNGISALKNSKSEFEKLYQICSEAGLFINPSGELEASLSEYGIPWQSDKRAWIRQALQLVPSLQTDNSKQPWKFTAEILEHLQRISN